jgi:arylsulfatase A-like enzyme
LETLKRLGIYEQTLVVLTSDHGEEFWEHGGYEHGHSLFGEVLRVPLIFKLPLSRDGITDSEVSVPVSTESVMPTILELCGIEHDNRFYADSLSSLWIRDSSSPELEPLVSSGTLYGEDREAVSFDFFKYVRFLKTGREELYDLDSDPKELNSLVMSHDEPLERARHLLNEHHARAQTARKQMGLVGEETIPLDKETIEALESLGYIQ